MAPDALSANHLSRRRLVGVLSWSLAAITIQACSSPSSPSPTAAPKSAGPTSNPVAPPASSPAATAKAVAPTAAPTVAPARAKWRHALTAAQIDTAFLVMGKEKGFFDEAGIDIEMPIVTSGDTLIKGVIAGEFDSGSPGPSVIFTAAESGAGVKIIGSDFEKVTQYLFAKRDINSLEDLYGRSVGVAGLGAYLHALATAAMKQKGLDPDRVTWVNIGGSPEVWTALVAEKVDAGVSGLEFIRDVEKYPYLHAVQSFAEILPNYMRNGVFTTDKALAERKDVIIRAMTAYVRGIRYALENKAEFVRVSKALTNRDEDTIAWTYDQYLKNRLVEPNFQVNPEAIAFTQQVAVDNGQLKAVIPFERIATTEIQNGVLAAIGEWTYR